MKARILNVLLVLSSLLGFLEWGEGSQLFLLQAEGEIIAKLFTDPWSVIHPLILLPLLAQILLLITIFQKRVSKIVTYIGIGGLSILLLLMFIIGLLSVNVKIILSVIPFLALAVYTINLHRKIRS
jgi:hypothetical protein